MMKIAYVVTIPESAWAFLGGQLRFFASRGDEVRLFSSETPLLHYVAMLEEAGSEGLPLTREISLWKDIRALWSTWRAFRRFRPDVTNVGTPKAGLIGGLAALLAGVPARVYVMHGIKAETAKGAKGAILKAMERLACACAHRVLCVSPSVREKAVALRLLPRRKAVVLGSGTVNGVDFERFSARPSEDERARLRSLLGVPEGVKIIGCVGRFTRDKGINELISAFDEIERAYPEVRLLMLGAFDEGDPVTAETRARIEAGGRIILAGTVSDTAPYYHIMDLLVLPTYREGFPTVCLEAGAAGLPVVATWATGARDAVIDGVTGMLVPVGDSGALAAALLDLLNDPGRAIAMGAASRERIRAEFQSPRIWAELDSLYSELLDRKRPNVESAA